MKKFITIYGTKNMLNIKNLKKINYNNIMKNTIPKKVAIMVSSLSGGGMERVASQLSVMLADSGFDVYILVCEFNRRKAYKHKGKVIVFPYTFFQNPSNGIKDIALMLYDACRINKIKNKYGIDFTISFASEMNFLNMLSGKKDKKILTIHSCLSLRNDFSGICYQRKFFKIYNKAYKVVTVSKWCKQDLVNYYKIKENKIQVIYNSVNIINKKYNVEFKENIILVVGRMHDVKQQWHIIRAFKKVKEEIFDAKLVFAGIGENRNYLKKLAKELDIEASVIFKGFVDKVYKLYEQAKLIVFSSASEAISCSVIEAIAYGVPVVAADCPGGIREVITHNDCCDDIICSYTLVSCGILVPKLDSKKYRADEPLTKAELEMAKGIVYILKNEQVRQTMVKNCLRQSRLFDEKIIKEQWLKLIKEKN